jgi:hypothetical protein
MHYFQFWFKPEPACGILRVIPCLYLHFVPNFLLPLWFFSVSYIGIVAVEYFTENLSYVFSFYMLE